VTAVVCLLLLARPAQAYTDPGTGALIWQLLAAAGIGILFYARKILEWFRLRKWRKPAETKGDER
jgi:hypothetical protein